MKGKYLITTDAWFYAPDGKQYKSVWGNIEIVDDKSALNISTNARSTNWYAKVGSDEKHIIVAGCQIHYAVKCDDKPNDGFADDYTIADGKTQVMSRPSNIYIAE